MGLKRVSESESEEKKTKAFFASSSFAPFVGWRGHLQPNETVRLQYAQNSNSNHL
jgi:hypothetical protein